MSIFLFSVCMPVYNGGDLVINALKSLENQTFDNFEVIIVDDDSKDGSHERIKNYLKNSNLNYQLYKNERNLGMVKNWNKTLEYATGKYIAFLHQDDSFKINHLEISHNILNKHQNIGIYAVKSQYSSRSLIGLIDPERYFVHTYKMINISAPSETIFIREKDNKRYLYNENDYSFSPEIELYLLIALDGFSIYHNNYQTVIRSSITTMRYSKRVYYTWIPFNDHFKILEKFRNNRLTNKRTYDITLNRLIIRARKRYLETRKINRGNAKEIYLNINKILYQKGIYKRYLMLVLRRVVFDLLNKILNKRIKLLYQIFIKITLRLKKV